MKFIARFSFMIMLFAFAGCLSWNEGWKSKSQPSGSGNAKELLSSAIALENTADSGDNIKRIISAYEKVIAADPENFTALTSLGEYSFLYGYTYAADKKEVNIILKQSVIAKRPCIQMQNSENFQIRVSPYGKLQVHFQQMSLRRCTGGTYLSACTGMT